MRPGAGIVPGVGVINVRPNAIPLVSNPVPGILMHSGSVRIRRIRIRLSNGSAVLEFLAIASTLFSDMISLSEGKVFSYNRMFRRFKEENLGVSNVRLVTFLGNNLYLSCDSNCRNLEE